MDPLGQGSLLRGGTGVALGHCCPPPVLAQGGQESPVVQAQGLCDLRRCQPSLCLSFPLCEMGLTEHTLDRAVGYVQGDRAHRQL